jgi:AcrR family transcriptional regulator
MAKAEPKRANGDRPLGEQGERTRAKLMDAARVVFRTRGYTAARVDDITRHAGTSHGAFYQYFANKEDVLEALAVQTAEQMYALADDLGAIERGEDAFDRLREWIGRFVDEYAHHAPVVNAWITADSIDSRFDRLGRQVLGQFSKRIATTIERAVDAGMRHPVEPTTAAIALVSMLERVCYFWIVRGDGAGFKREPTIDTLATIWYEAIFGQRA